MLVTNLKARRSCPCFKIQVLREHFGEKLRQQFRERWGNVPPWMSVLEMRRREEDVGFCTV
jgi:hypothetical protein